MVMEHARARHGECPKKAHRPLLTVNKYQLLLDNTYNYYYYILYLWAVTGIPVTAYKAISIV